MFWLHHCNIDRLYQACLEAHPDSVEEMAAVQRNLHEQGEPDGFEAALAPFVNPKTGEPARPEQAFSSTADLLFAYDRLPEAPPARQRQPPTLALFKDIKLQDTTQVRLSPWSPCFSACCAMAALSSHPNEID